MEDIKILFNSAGAIYSTDIGAIRQGDVGNTLYVFFTGKSNSSYTATLIEEKSNKETSALLVMSPCVFSYGGNNYAGFKFIFSDAWFFDKSGTTFLTIRLYDPGENIICSGLVEFSIEQTIIPIETNITPEQENSILNLLSKKLNTIDYSYIRRVDTLPTTFDPNDVAGQLYEVMSKSGDTVGGQLYRLKVADNVLDEIMISDDILKYANIATINFSLYSNGDIVYNFYNSTYYSVVETKHNALKTLSIIPVVFATYSTMPSQSVIDSLTIGVSIRVGTSSYVFYSIIAGTSTFAGNIVSYAPKYAPYLTTPSATALEIGDLIFVFGDDSYYEVIAGTKTLEKVYNVGEIVNIGFPTSRNAILSAYADLDAGTIIYGIFGFMSDFDFRKYSSFIAVYDSTYGELTILSRGCLVVLNNSGATISKTATTANVDAVIASLASHTSNVSNPHSVTKAQVGLGNVDNTSDLNKPISTATQTALNLKADKSDTYTKTEVDNKLATVYKYKGTLADMAALNALTGMAVGDLYNVIDAGTEGTNVNFAWTGSAWDNIGGVEALATASNNGMLSKEDFVKLSALYTKAQLDTLLLAKADKTNSVQRTTVLTDTIASAYATYGRQIAVNGSGGSYIATIFYNGTTYDIRFVGTQKNGVRSALGLAGTITIADAFTASTTDYAKLISGTTFATLVGASNIYNVGYYTINDDTSSTYVKGSIYWLSTEGVATSILTQASIGINDTWFNTKLLSMGVSNMPLNTLLSSLTENLTYVVRVAMSAADVRLVVMYRAGSFAYATVISPSNIKGFYFNFTGSEATATISSLLSATALTTINMLTASNAIAGSLKTSLDSTYLTVGATTEVPITIASLIANTNTYFDTTGAGTSGSPYIFTPKATVNHSGNVYTITSVTSPASDIYCFFRAKGNARVQIRVGLSAVTTTYGYLLNFQDYFGKVRYRITSAGVISNANIDTKVATGNIVTDINSPDVYNTHTL